MSKMVQRLWQEIYRVIENSGDFVEEMCVLRKFVFKFKD